VARLKRPESLAVVALIQLRKGTYWSKKVESFRRNYLAALATTFFTLRECFAHPLTVGLEALDGSASNEILDFARTMSELAMMQEAKLESSGCSVRPGAIS
jgi:hypothetical protein